MSGPLIGCITSCLQTKQAVLRLKHRRYRQRNLIQKFQAHCISCLTWRLSMYHVSQLFKVSVQIDSTYQCVCRFIVLVQYISKSQDEFNMLSVQPEATSYHGSRHSKTMTRAFVISLVPMRASNRIFWPSSPSH